MALNDNNILVFNMKHVTELTNFTWNNTFPSKNEFLTWLTALDFIQATDR